LHEHNHTHHHRWRTADRYRQLFRSHL
jgi:hypothetical protein